MISETKNSAILIIDIQEKLLNAVFNKEQLLKNSITLAKTAEILGIPVFITEQYPKGLGKTIEGISSALPDAKYYEKTVFNALRGTQLSQDLRKSGRLHIITAGIESHICVHQTVSGLLKKGYDVTVLSDVCGSRSKENHEAGMRVMERNKAQVKPLEMVIFELLMGSSHKNFKEIQELIK